MNQNYSKTIKDLSGPKGFPLVGNLFQVEQEKIHINLEDWAKEYGDFYKVNFPGAKIVVMSNPDHIAYLLKNRPSKFRRLSKMVEIMEEIGFYGLFTAENETWKKHRKVTQQALSHKNVKNYFPLILKIADRLEAYWEKEIDGRDSLHNYEISHDFMNATIDITTNLAFGSDLNTIHDQREVTQEHISKIIPKLNERTNLPIPIWRYIKMPSDRDFDKSMNILKDIIGGFIQKSKDNLEAFPERNENPTNFLEALLSSQDKENPFSMDEIYGSIYTMLLTGEDTTANSLSWFTYFIAADQDLQEKIYNEISSVLGEDEGIEEIEEIKQFKYLYATIQEVLRMKPPGPLMYYQNNEEVVMGDILFPKDTFFITLIRSGGMDENNFSEPDKMIPERWLSKESECPYHGNHKEEVIVAFGGGPRYCPGKFLSETEMVVFIVKMMKNYKIELDVPLGEISEKYDFTMVVDNMKVRMIKREKNEEKKEQIKEELNNQS